MATASVLPSPSSSTRSLAATITHASLPTTRPSSSSTDENFKLKQQVDALQAKLVEIKQRARHAIREALAAGGRSSAGGGSTGGTGSKPPYRARTCSLDSLESGLGPIKEDCVFDIDKSAELLESSQLSSISSSSATTTASSASTPIPSKLLCGIFKERTTIIVPSMTQLVNAIVSARKGDASGLKTHMVWFVAGTYLVVIHLVLVLYVMWQWGISCGSGTL